MGLMGMKIKVTTHEEQAREDREYWMSRTPEERLDEVERLRIEWGKIHGGYPSPLRKDVISVTWREPR